jgi:hypothetical protein
VANENRSLQSRVTEIADRFRLENGLLVGRTKSSNGTYKGGKEVKFMAEKHAGS